MYEFKKSFFNNKSYLVFQSAAEGVLACSMKEGLFFMDEKFFTMALCRNLQIK